MAHKPPRSLQSEISSGHTDRQLQTDRRTDRTTTVTLAAHARRGLIIVSLLRVDRGAVSNPLFNPRRACAARVTVVVCVSVCLFVCLSATIFALQTSYEAAYEPYQQLQCYKGQENERGDFTETIAFERYGVKAKKPICIMSTGLPRPGLARSAHR